MKRRLSLAIVIAGLAMPLAAQNTEWWVIGFGRIEALFNRTIAEAAYNRQIAANPNDSWDAKFQSLYAGRADIDMRIQAAVAELCTHDESFCAETFQRYALRWAK